MKSRRVKELFRKERRLGREIRRKQEQHEELVAEAMSTGSFRYDQDRVTGSSPDGSRQERLVIEYMKLEEEIMKMAAEQEEIMRMIRILISTLPVRERRIMVRRHIYHEEVEDVIQRFGISYETYKIYHKSAMKRMEKVIDSIPQI